MDNLIGLALIIGPSMLIGAMIGFSKGYWTGYRDGFSCRAKEVGNG